MLRNAFTSRDPALWKRLYTIYVRPHLEFAVAAWNPQSKGCIGRLERVQRRATRIPSGSKGIVYSQRCIRLGLTSLEKRRMRGDMITMFKLKNRMLIVNWLGKRVVVKAGRGRRDRERR